MAPSGERFRFPTGIEGETITVQRLDRITMGGSSLIATVDGRRLFRNFAVYGIGIAIAVVGALGLIAVVPIPVFLAAGSFVLGIGLVIAVHEFLDGPL